MGNFNFRLQSVLDLNTRRKRSAATEFAGAMRTLRDRELELKSFYDELHELGLSRSESSEARRADDIQYIRVRMTKCQNDISLCQERIQAQLTVIEEKREELDLARQEEKKMDMLKSRHYSVWQRDMNRAEQRRLDETAGQRRYQLSMEKKT